MEMKTIEIETFEGQVINIRVIMERKDMWFLVADICKALKTKTKPARLVVENEKNKRKIKVKMGKQIRECLFVNNEGADDIINRSRGEASKEMKEIYYQITRKDKKVKLL